MIFEEQFLQIHLKDVCNKKGGGLGSWLLFEDGSDRGDRCQLLFNFVVVFSLTNFRFRFVKTS
jgi:hypothetical protein